MTKSRAKSEGAANRAVPDSEVSERPILSSESGELAKRLKEALGDETVSSFSRRCGLSEAVLRSYINDGRTPALDKALAIANAAGVTVDWLATGRPPKTRAEYLKQRPNEVSADGFDGGRAMLEAILKTVEARIAAGTVNDHVITAGLYGAPSWLDSSMAYPDLHLRFRSMVAMLELLKATQAK